jgi:GntR family transcriptional repressor for pyruvate dehydrogenase complex
MPVRRVSRRAGRPGRAPRHKVTRAVVRAIQERLERGSLRPGARLPSERELARQLGASRSSVREALRALELAGLIRAHQGGGTFVADPLPVSVATPLAQYLDRQRATLRDLFEARQMIEPRLAFLAAERATREDIEALRAALARQEHADRDGDLEAASTADRAFHQAVAEATHNQTFIMLHNYLSDLVAGNRRDAADSAARRAQALVDHRAIVDAIARHDAPAASAAMLQHLKNVEALLLDTLSAYQGVLAFLPGTRATREVA